jgi:hypothetical protein
MDPTQPSSHDFLHTSFRHSSLDALLTLKSDT